MPDTGFTFQGPLYKSLQLTQEFVGSSQPPGELPSCAYSKEPDGSGELVGILHVPFTAAPGIIVVMWSVTEQLCDDTCGVPPFFTLCQTPDQPASDEPRTDEVLTRLKYTTGGAPWDSPCREARPAHSPRHHGSSERQTCRNLREGVCVSIFVLMES
jgi:hypothetical protein